MPQGITHFQTLLAEKKLRVTKPRLAVLEAVSASETAVTQPELEKQLGTDFDRVTLYRCLAVFEEKGILHKVFDLQGTAAYAICQSSCSSHQHHDQHVHFICTQCNSIYCLEEIAIPAFNLPAHYTLNSVGVNATGICAVCKTG